MLIFEFWSFKMFPSPKPLQNLRGLSPHLFLCRLDWPGILLNTLACLLPLWTECFPHWKCAFRLPHLVNSFWASVEPFRKPTKIIFLYVRFQKKSPVVKLFSYLLEDLFGGVFSFWLYHMACGVLVPQWGIGPEPSAVRPWSLDHRTARESLHFYNCLNYESSVCSL